MILLHSPFLPSSSGPERQRGGSASQVPRYVLLHCATPRSLPFSIRLSLVLTPSHLSFFISYSFSLPSSCMCLRIFFFSGRKTIRNTALLMNLFMYRYWSLLPSYSFLRVSRVYFYFNFPSCIVCFSSSSFLISLQLYCSACSPTAFGSYSDPSACPLTPS